MEQCNFTPKVNMLEQLNVEIDDNDEDRVKITSKRKRIDNGVSRITYKKRSSQE